MGGRVPAPAWEALAAGAAGRREEDAGTGTYRPTGFIGRADARESEIFILLD
jgi:hypothetical protein